MASVVEGTGRVGLEALRGFSNFTIALFMRFVGHRVKVLGMAPFESCLFLFLNWGAVGCSTAFSLGYEAGPYLVGRELEKRLPLSDRAEEQLDKDLQRYFEWHRAKMLTSYITKVEAWRSEVRAPKLRSTDQWLMPDIQTLITDTLLPLAEIVCLPMSNYTAEEVAELRKLDRDAQEERKAKQGGSKEEERERRWERFESFIEDWIGDVEKGQRPRWRSTFEKAINSSSKRSSKGREEWDSFVAELEQGMTLPRCFEHMQRWLIPSPETRSERNAGWIPLYDQILRELSSDQRRHLDEELADWVDRFRGLRD